MVVKIKNSIKKIETKIYVLGIKKLSQQIIKNQNKYDSNN